jgi:hypothetical protein
MRVRHRTISSVHLGRLSVLRSILNAWVTNNISLAVAWKGEDVPWWYNERALLSVFSGGIWKKNGLALEEYSTTKTWKRKRGKGREHYQCRQDIYFKLGKHEFIGEVKDGWSSLHQESKYPERSINSVMKKAIRDIEGCPPHGKRRLAVVFVKTYITRGRSKSLDKSIIDWANKVKKAVDYTCCAWVFPASSRTFCYKRKVYPGVGIFIKEIRGKGVK